MRKQSTSGEQVDVSHQERIVLRLRRDLVMKLDNHVAALKAQGMAITRTGLITKFIVDGIARSGGYSRDR